MARICDRCFREMTNQPDTLRAENARLTAELALRNDCADQVRAASATITLLADAELIMDKMERDGWRLTPFRALAAEVRALRTDLIWAVDHGASGGYDGNSDPCIWYSVERTDKYDHNRKLETAATDGTHEDRLRAVREARGK